VRHLATPRRSTAAAAVLILLTAACGGTEPAEPEVVDDAVPVTVAIARIETLRDVLVTPGVVAPASLGDWTIYAPEPGVVAELPKSEGEAIATGDLLVRFDILSISQRISTREAFLADAEQRQQDAQREMDRQQALFDQGLVARNTYQATRSALDAAAAQVTQAQAELEIAQTLLETTRIRSRFDGVVAAVWKTEGDFTDGSQNDPILRVVDPTRTQVVVELPVEQAPRISTGQVASIAAPVAELPLIGTVARIDMPTGLADTLARVRINYDDTTPLELDTAVRVELVLEQRPDAVVLPADAVLRDEAGTFVLIAGADLVAHRREVRIGLAVNGLVHVTQGLDAGERVIVGGADSVADGQAVRVGR